MSRNFFYYWSVGAASLNHVMFIVKYKHVLIYIWVKECSSTDMLYITCVKPSSLLELSMR